MNEIVQVRMNSWAAMVKARIESGMTIRDWCAANGVSMDAYYYRLRQLRKSMINKLPEAETDSTSQFVQIQFQSIRVTGS